MKKLKLLIPALVTFLYSTAQYKDLEGVFFGKVIALGAGYSIHGYSDKGIGTQSSLTAINYSVLVNKKFIASSRLAFHKKFTLVYNGEDFGTPYCKLPNLNLSNMKPVLSLPLHPMAQTSLHLFFLRHWSELCLANKKHLIQDMAKLETKVPVKLYLEEALRCIKG